MCFTPYIQIQMRLTGALTLKETQSAQDVWSVGAGDVALTR